MSGDPRTPKNDNENDPRIEAAARAMYEHIKPVLIPWERVSVGEADSWRSLARDALAAADAVDPLRQAFAAFMACLPSADTYFDLRVRVLDELDSDILAVGEPESP